MRDTLIRWTNHTWNPMVGCSQVSPGCAHCYAKSIAERFGPPAYPHGFDPTFKPDKLRLPATWREPGMVFVNSMSDLFHEAFTDAQIDQVFDAMLAVPRHSYQILTKRPLRMRSYCLGWLHRQGLDQVPAHIWLGTSIENNRWDGRRDVLVDIPVAVHFISAEPLLGPLPDLDLAHIEWLIVGGESGPRYRPMDHAWARGLRDRALAAGTAYYFKQSAAPRTEMGMELDGQRWEQYPETARRPLSQTHAQAALAL